MLTSDERDRVVVVLVRARNPGNIGAVARAMHDFGFRFLRVVNGYETPLESAKSAVDATSVIASAQVCVDVAEAIKDCTLVVGTTAVGRRDLRHPLVTLGVDADRLLAEVQGTPPGRVALLFGSEKTGLSNEELSYCNVLATIPMAEHDGIRHPSMNLGQAAAVFLYELVRDDGVPTRVERTAPLAEDLERLSCLVTDVLEQIGYRKRNPARCDPAEVRKMVRRMGLAQGEEAMWMGIFRQVLWRIKGE